jgi:hypothetical protein
MQLAADDRLPLAKRRITSEEARAAVYIDFEGRINEPPVLLGELHATGRTISAEKPVLVHYILDPQFQRLKSDCHVPTLHRYAARYQPLAQALHEIILLARKRDRLIVSWSQHELRKVLELGLDGMHAEEFAHRYRDGKDTAKRWQRKLHADVELVPTRSGRLHSLVNYMKLIDYQLPDESYGIDRTGENLKALSQALERRETWDDLTPRQQDRWIEVLGHNMHDCLALREIVTRAAADLDSLDA